MISFSKPDDLPDSQRIVITGIGLTSPNGNNLGDFRESLLTGESANVTVISDSGLSPTSSLHASSETSSQVPNSASAVS